jgi:putative acetyltransferase
MADLTEAPDGDRRAVSDVGGFEIREDDLTGDDVRALLALHAAGMRASSPPDACFVLDLSGLLIPEITVWSIWRGPALAGVGALKRLPGAVGELKSMRTHPDHLRTGAASRLLDHMLGVARQRGLKRISLETGRGPSFEPALAMYRKRGFEPGEAFADYPPGDFSQFLHLDL